MNVNNRQAARKHSGSNVLIAFAFGALAAALGLVLGRHDFDLPTVLSAMASSYILADKRGWLTEQERTAANSRNAGGAMALYGVLVILYVVATDNQGMLLMPGLFLPVVLAGLFYQARVGLAVSAGMAALYVFNAAGQHQTAAPPQIVCAALSFPGVALFVRVLARRLEERFHDLSDRTSELSALLDMTQMMDAAIDLDTTLNLILLNVQRLSGCQVCAVYLQNAAGDTLELRAASGRRDRMALAPSLATADARCGHWSIQESDQPEAGVAAFYAADVSVGWQDRKPSPLFGLDRRAESFACVPLSSIEGLLGMLYVGYDAADGLGKDGVPRLENLAVRAAFSLQRAVAQQGYRSLAFSDAMTGLDNFRQFEQDLGDEMRRAERYDRPLSVILFDIDHFKKFNDTLGHQAGDALLAQMATVLRDSLRSVDKPARYGGEEFVVVCPETGEDEARLIAERIRRNVEQTTFTLLGTPTDGAEAPPNFGVAHVTVSVGFATFPRDAGNSRDLVKRADQALYTAKHAGRNAVRGCRDVPAQVAA